MILTRFNVNVSDLKRWLIKSVTLFSKKRKTFFFCTICWVQVPLTLPSSAFTTTSTSTSTSSSCSCSCSCYCSCSCSCSSSFSTTATTTTTTTATCSLSSSSIDKSCEVIDEEKVKNNDKEQSIIRAKMRVTLKNILLMYLIWWRRIGKII